MNLHARFGRKPKAGGCGLHASRSSISASFRAILCRLARSSSCPAIAGKGDHPSAERLDGGRGAGRDETLSTKAKRRVRRPLHHASRGPPPPLSRRAENITLRSRAALFVCAPSFANGFTKRASPRGRRSAERRVLRDHSALSQRCRWAGSWRAPLLADALAFRRSTAALAKTFRRWLSPVPRFMAAPTDVTPSATRAASSSQTGVGAGRAGFRTARERSYEPHPGHRSRPHQSAVTG